MYIHYKVRDEIAFPIPNFNDAVVEAWVLVSNFIQHITGYVITYRPRLLTWIKVNLC